MSIGEPSVPPVEFSLMQASWVGRIFRRRLMLSARGVTYNDEVLIPPEGIIAFGLVPVHKFHMLHLWYKEELAGELPGFLRRGKKGLPPGEMRLFPVSDEAAGFRTHAYVEQIKQFAISSGIGQWRTEGGR